MDVPAKVLKEGFQQARRITKKFAKTFYLASLLLPAEKKYASYAIYALCRLSDEAVDNSSSADPEGALRKLSEKIALACGREEIKDPLLAAFGCTVKACGIPEDY
ncbi:MAG: squalene/phytoene synthase family protein, partial [Candidatus Omnitrophota bacterium]